MKNIFKKIVKSTLIVPFILNIFMPSIVLALDSTHLSGGTTDIYVVWNCDGEVCVSDAITVNNGVEGSGGMVTYATNYIKESTVVDSVKTKTIDVSAVTGYNKQGQVTNWYIYEDVTDIRNFATWEAFDVAIHEGDYPMGIDPTGGKDGINSISHNGDRKCRVTIYDDSKYESLTFNVNPNNYTYYLGLWFPVFTNPTIDISGSTKENPVVYTTYLLEDTLKFSAGEKNKENIVSVKALDVPSKGISITKTGDEYTVKFKSNYYSEVILELTGASGGKYYVKVNRSFIESGSNLNDLFAGTSTTPTIYAKFTYPSTTAYTDYDVIATITKKDGTIETKKLDAVKLTDFNNESGMLETKYVWDAGVKLNMTGFAIEASEDFESVEVTVTLKNATSSETYGGTFGGHNKGISLDIDFFMEHAFTLS